MTKTKYTREQLLEVLRAGDPVVVTFTKVDGTKRDMRCTLQGHKATQGESGCHSRLRS